MGEEKVFCTNCKYIPIFDSSVFVKCKHPKNMINNVNPIESTIIKKRCIDANIYYNCPYYTPKTKLSNKIKSLFNKIIYEKRKDNPNTRTI